MKAALREPEEIDPYENWSPNWWWYLTRQTDDAGLTIWGSKNYRWGVVLSVTWMDWGVRFSYEDDGYHCSPERPCCTREAKREDPEGTANRWWSLQLGPLHIVLRSQDV